MPVFDDIVGAEKVISRFGGWPPFHDAPVLRLTFDWHRERGLSVEMLIHAWLMTDEVDDRGYYRLEKHTLVRLVFDRVTVCELSDFVYGCIIFALRITPETNGSVPGFRVVLQSSCGLTGEIVCGGISVAEVSACDEDGNVQLVTVEP